MLPGTCSGKQINVIFKGKSKQQVNNVNTRFGHAMQEPKSIENQRKVLANTQSLNSARIEYYTTVLSKAQQQRGGHVVTIDC